MSPMNVTDTGGEARISKTKVTGLLLALIGAERLAESMFGFKLLPAGVDEKIGPVVDLIFTVGGFFVIVFRGKKG